MFWIVVAKHLFARVQDQFSKRDIVVYVLDTKISIQHCIWHIYVENSPLKYIYYNNNKT